MEGQFVRPGFADHFQEIGSVAAIKSASHMLCRVALVIEHCSVH